jgi:hypothetical protein
MRARSESAAVAEFDLMAPDEDDPRLMMSMFAGLSGRYGVCDCVAV